MQEPWLITTEDGSSTVISSIFNERYHSIYGARTESQVVFIDAGLHDAMDRNEEVKVLEMGFGTGLNAFMTLENAESRNIQIKYVGYEKFPIEREKYLLLNYGDNSDFKSEFLRLHESDWNTLHTITDCFQFEKRNQDIDSLMDEDCYDVIYFDAFAPNAQEELWQPEIFVKMYNALKKGACLVTYCAKGQVKRNMKSAGFVIEALPGPPGKREMTRALKAR